jgi:hypothetical protein
MTDCRAVKVEYALFSELEESDSLSISINECHDPAHGKMIALEQDGEVVWFPVAFADVIRAWAKGDKDGK